MTEPTVLPSAPVADLATPEGRAHYARSLDCIHCGLCLPVCPTYALSGRETSSPRGRIYLMRAAADGRLEPGPAYEEELHFCLVCRACETVCPSGVQFEALMEHARADHVRAHPPRGLRGLLRRILLRRVIPSRGALRLAASALSLYARTPLRRWIGGSGLLARLAPALAAREALLPEVPSRSARRDLPARIPAEGARRGVVAIQEGCIASQLLADVNASTARVLARSGWEVVTWRAPSCCGALHAHAGDLGFARDLARRNVESFERSGADWFVQNSAGCGAHVKSFARLLEQDAAWKPRAEAVAARTRDVTEFLAEQGFAPRRAALRERVAYDEPCHLVHGQRVSAQPRKLLAALPGATLVPLEGASDCCGAAGLYSIERTADSLAILDAKMERVRASGCTVLATANPGCILQLRTGVRRAGLDVRVAHVVELLDG